MFKRFSYIFAYLLLALMPLQSIAAANMLVCNSMMQSHSSPEQQGMACHKHMASTEKAGNHETNIAHSTDTHKTTCKSTCGTLCSTLCAMTALASNINTTINANSSPLLRLADPSYASVTLPNSQRPPIFLS
jgi:hypothetical protein